MKYILIIYLIVSIANVILFELYTLNMINYAKREIKKKNIEIEKQKTSISEHILPQLKIVIMSFLPIYNVIMLLVMLFKGDMFDEEVDKRLKDLNKGE